MKTKTLLKLSVIAALPALFSTLLVCVIALEWFLSGQSRIAQAFLAGTFNIKFTMIFFGLGFLSICVIIFALAGTVRHADNIDRLEDARYEWFRSKMKYEAATRKLVEQTKPE
jgi:glycerol-3-phosphate acyltransferase PlsY